MAYAVLFWIIIDVIMNKAQEFGLEVQKTEISTSIERNNQAEAEEQKQNTNTENASMTVKILPGESSPGQNIEQDTKEEGEVTEDASKNINLEESCSQVSNVETQETNVTVEAIEDSGSSLKYKSFEKHPYKELLLNFSPTVDQLSEVSDIKFPKTLKQTPLIEISSKEDFEKLIHELKDQKEIGVDVEYSDHGYKALTCLVQISTVDKDYIIDAIVLKDDMNKLNQIFTDPSILKIFHAANNDMKWLQQDFQVFVVNMFDTQVAMKALGYQRIGLDVLLQEYNVTKNKSMQRADFRKRPLSPEFKDYARTDSHYLIPMYYKLKNDLLLSNLLRQVFVDCNNCCKIVYETIDDEAYESVVAAIKKKHQHQLFVLEKLNKWRHNVAEYSDMSTGYILSKNNLKALVEQMPCNPNEILKIAKSGYVKKHLNEVVAIMRLGNVEKKHQVQDIQSSQRGGDTSKIYQNKRKLGQTDFGNTNQAPGFSGTRNKRHKNFNDNSQTVFDLRNALKKSSAPFRRNRGRFQHYQ